MIIYYFEMGDKSFLKTKDALTIYGNVMHLEQISKNENNKFITLPYIVNASLVFNKAHQFYQ